MGEMKFLKDYFVKNVGGTMAFVGKEPFEIIGAEPGDPIIVKVVGDEIIITKKVDKK